MDGGVDAAITAFFGTNLQKRVQKFIIENYEGEQPVGTSFIIETGDVEHPFVAHTPTMRVPYSIQGTDYVYLAMKALLNTVRKFNENSTRKIKTVACTGLGTFYGQMKLKEAGGRLLKYINSIFEKARQMALAYRNFLEPPKEINWMFASSRQEEVKYGGLQGFKLAEFSLESDEQSRREIAEAMDEYAMSINRKSSTKITRPLTEAEQLYVKAVQLEKEGKPMEAMELYRKAFKLQPDLEDEDINGTLGK